jgi:hypothetical protein
MPGLLTSLAKNGCEVIKAFLIYSISRFVLVLQLVEKFLNCKSISRALENPLKAQNLLQVLEHDTKC